MRVPLIIVCGDKEEANDTVAVRTRGNKKIEFGVKLDDFVKQAKDETGKRADN